MLQSAWAQLLMWLTGRHDIAFGAVVSGRPAELAGAESMVGLLINTVPVRATITAATTTTDLLHQLQRAHNDTLEHQHLALTDIHRLTGHQRLFDTVFVYENYPIDTADVSSVDGLSITQLTVRDYYHYPLAVQAVPGPQLDLRVQYRTDVFDSATITTLMEHYQRILVAMTTHPNRPLPSTNLPARMRSCRPNRQPPRCWLPSTPTMMVIARPQHRSNRLLPTFSLRCWVLAAWGSTSRFSTWAEIRLLPCGQSPRLTRQRVHA
ncbi:condensation domain protein [Mycobacterium xenopi 4042]|uniref:Condensation domain protein n=1 Tax=Mycobacterium xenopi 4042 TaxID=1299334 RepID=X8DL13_MYCXE|nr:condensation domain protein [Mycobacterium xenopi 4042]